jgi:hypothetical protein
MALCAALLAGCGAPPELEATPAPQLPTSATPAAAPSPALPADLVLPTTPPVTGSPKLSFAEAQAVPCNGHPTATQVITVVRQKSGLRLGTTTITARTGPLCAGTWQYTLLTVTGQEPLAVVTTSNADSLTLVTAGTNVCSIPVRTGAPPGILIAAGC